MSFTRRFDTVIPLERMYDRMSSFYPVLAMN